MLDVDLQRWTPVRGWKRGSHQYTTSSNSTTLESNKSDVEFIFGKVVHEPKLAVPVLLCGLEELLFPELPRPRRPLNDLAGWCRCVAVIMISTLGGTSS